MYEDVLVPTDGSEASDAAIERAIEYAGRAAIAAVTERAEAAGVGTVEAFIGRGTPYRVILDYVADNDVDLVVRGTHGRTGLDRYLLGSTTEKVVRLSDVPVLTVRAAPPSDDG